MSVQVDTFNPRDLIEFVRLDRWAFAAKIRAARAILGWSQSEFGRHVGLTQRSVHKLECGETEPRRATVRAIDSAWHQQGLVFEDLADGGFRVVVRADVIERTVASPDRRKSAADAACAGHAVRAYSA